MSRDYFYCVVTMALSISCSCICPFGIHTSYHKATELRTSFFFFFFMVRCFLVQWDCSVFLYLLLFSVFCLFTELAKCLTHFCKLICSEKDHLNAGAFTHFVQVMWNGMDVLMTDAFFSLFCVPARCIRPQLRTHWNYITMCLEIYRRN